MTERLRIGFLVHDYNRFGGHSRYVAELACRFRRDHEVHVFSNTFDEPDPTRITHHHVPAWRANALTTVLSFMLPVTWAVRGSFDIVHAQGLCGFRQDVVTAHMCQAGWTDGVKRWASPQPLRKHFFAAITRVLERWVFWEGAAGAFIAVSEHVRRDLLQHHRLRDRVKVIHHGVDTETFHPRNRERWRGDVRAALGLDESCFVALYVGDWHKAGVPLLAMLSEVSGVHLLAVTRSNRIRIRDSARDLGVAARLTVLSETRAIERFYAAADVFVFPSFYDTFGMVVAEAMATGLPVIVSRAAGAAEWVDPGENGLLLEEPWDHRALSAAVMSLARDHALQIRLSVAARRTAELHTWDSVAAETMDVYRSVLRQRNQ
jgi:UDP-glucose:(heptosyl)LPS alpha-1,3-glucosyltransferase